MLTIFFCYSSDYSLDVLLKEQILQIPSKGQGADFVNVTDNFKLCQKVYF